MSLQKNLSRRRFLKSLATVGGAVAGSQMLAACQPKVVEVEKVVEKVVTSVVKETVMVEGTAQVVEKVVEKVVTAPPAAGAKKTVVTFTMFGHPDMIEQMVPLFNETHPSVDLQFERSEGQGYNEKLLASLAGGTGWDLFRIGGTQIKQYGSRGAIAKITELVQADTIYPMGSFVKGVLDEWYVDGEIVGLPCWTNTYFMFYNARLFDEAGVAYPTKDMTWDTYLEMCLELTKRDGDTITQYGSANFASSLGRSKAHIENNGGEYFYSKDLSTLIFDTPIAVEALQYEADMMNKHKVHPSPLSPPSTPVTLLSGKVATTLDGDYLPWDKKDAWLDEYQCCELPLMPGADKKVSFWTGGLGINASSKVKEAAYSYLSWFSADPASWKIQGGVVFPTVQRMYEEESLRKLWLTSPRPQTMIDLANEHVTMAAYQNNGVFGAEIQAQVYDVEIADLWLDKTTAADVLAKIQTKAEEMNAKLIAG